MRVVYSLNGLKSRGRLQLIVDSYRLSILMMKKFHPNIRIYVNEEIGSHFEDLDIDIQYLSDRHGDPEYLWSEAKYEALSRESGESVLVDGDLFMTTPIELPSKGVLAESKEHVWDKLYKSMYKEFDSKGVRRVFPEWGKYDKRPINTSILYFSDPSFKERFLDGYNKVREFMLNQFTRKGIILDGMPSLIASQHVLNCLVSYYGVELTLAEGKLDYAHFYGDKKYNSTYTDFIKSMLTNLEKDYESNK